MFCFTKLDITRIIFVHILCSPIKTLFIYHWFPNIHQSFGDFFAQDSWTWPQKTSGTSTRTNWNITIIQNNTLHIYIPYTYTLRIPIPHIHKTYTLHQPNWSSRIASSRKSRIQVTHGCILVIRRPGDHGPTAGFPKSRGGPQKKTDSDGLMVI